MDPESLPRRESDAEKREMIGNEERNEGSQMSHSKTSSFFPVFSGDFLMIPGMKGLNL